MILMNIEKDVRKITYSKEQDDHAIVLVTELVNNELFAKLVSDKTVHIIFKVVMLNLNYNVPRNVLGMSLGMSSECPSEK